MTGPAGRSERHVLLRRLGPAVAVVLTVLLLDLVTKAAAVAGLHEGQKLPVLALGGAVTVTVARSPGFSVVTILSWLLAVLAAVVMVGIARRDRRLRSPGWGVAAGLVLGGVLGNLVDRLRALTPDGRGGLGILSVGGAPAFNAADVSIVLGAAAMALLAVIGGVPEQPVQHGDEQADPTGLDPDDEKVALLDRPKYPASKWDPMPGKRRYLPSLESDAPSSPSADPDRHGGVGEREPQDTDDLIDEDDRLPGRTRHPAAKWERE